MTEIEWLASEEPAMMLRETPALSDRKARLLTVAIERHWWADTGDKSVAPALAVLESWADSHLDEHSEGVRRYHRYYWWLGSDPHAALSESIRVHNVPADQITWANLLREVVGNPFRRWTIQTWPRIKDGDIYFDPAWLTWRDSTVPRLARAIYAGRLWAEMPILADALEEAGCPDGDLLRHCRGQERCYCTVDGLSSRACPVCHCTGWMPLRGPHCRGCWCLDVILGLS